MEGASKQRKKESLMGSVSKERKIELFNLLLKARRVEERLVELVIKGAIPGWLHSMLGQEAVGVGVVSNLKPTDLVNNTHRGRAILLTKGVPLKYFMAETLGRKAGPCGGIAGEMHFCDAKYGVVGGSGYIGAQIPVMVGMALACQHRNTGQVVVNVLGDGTVDNGYFHESINVASKWKLPMVFVVENNRWAQFVPQEATAAQPEIWRKAEAYNMPGLRANGRDVLEVYKTSREAIARARKGEGPTLLEYMVDRWTGHYIGDPQKYRDPKDIEEVRKNDPVVMYQNRLVDEKILTPEYIEKLEKSIKAEIEDAIGFAQNSPPATEEQAFQNVYI
jgi:TPP-dependent pyruvate/acetoin dehydrogenase alpha subunit